MDAFPAGLVDHRIDQGEVIDAFFRLDQIPVGTGQEESRAQIPDRGPDHPVHPGRVGTGRVVELSANREERLIVNDQILSAAVFR